MNAYEFIIKLKDRATSRLMRIKKSLGLTNREGNRMNKTFSKMKGIMATAFAVGAVVMFTSQVIAARSEYEKFQAVLANTLGSQELGDSAFAMLGDFAANTPFQINELTGAFIKLVNRGFNPTRDEMTKIGDLASSQGKSFDQLTEAILDAQTAEFERLKEFGIKASKSGDKVSFTFKGVTKTVQNNETAIRNAIIAYGALDGVQDSMQAQMKTLGGRISNLKDQWWQFLVAVGGQTQGIFGAVISYISKGLAFITKHLNAISMWFELLGEAIAPVINATKNFLMQMTGFTSAGDVVSWFGDIMTKVLFVVGIFTDGLVTLLDWLSPFATEIGVVAAAFVGLNLVFAMSPIGWVVLGIMALITAIGLVTKYTSGWKDSFEVTGESIKNVVKLLVMGVKNEFTSLVYGFEIVMRSLRKSYYEFKNKMGLGDKNENKAIIDQLDKDIQQRKKAIVENQKALAVQGEKTLNSFGITIDKEGFKKDFQKLKERFSGLSAPKKASGGLYEDFANKNKNPLAPGGKTQGDETSTTVGGKADGISSGGRKNITINIGKLHDKIEVHVTNMSEGVQQTAQDIKEELLRVVNSINHAQTS